MKGMLAMNLGEILKTADWATLEGLQTVLLGLILLFVLLHLAVTLVARVRRGTRKTAQDNDFAENSISATVPMQDDAAIVAAITAAITAMREEAGESSAFRVVSFGRLPSDRQGR